MGCTRRHFEEDLQVVEEVGGKAKLSKIGKGHPCNILQL